MNAIGAGITALLIVVVLIAPRKWAVIGLMAGVLYLTQKQAIDLFGLNLTAIRIMEVAGVIRIVARGEVSFLRANSIDRALMLLYGYTTTLFFIRSATWQAEILGTMVDATLCYFLFRCLIRTIDDLEWFLRVFAIVLVPFVALLSVEMMTRENPFKLMGGETSEVRNDRLRCLGSFRNSSSLGTFGASLFPLYIGLAFLKGKRVLAFIGVAFSLGILYFANSGGPLSAAAIGAFGWLCWPLRRRMVVIRYALVGGVALLALVMKAPIWYLIDRVSSVTGGTGWHRAYLMDVAFQNIGKWWLVGMEMSETRDWFPYILGITGAADITNNFIDFGLHAGVFAIALLVLLLVRAFQSIGQALMAVRLKTKRNDHEYLLWALGCALAVHVVSWLGITYFDQMYFAWFMQLATISSISQACVLSTRTTDVTKVSQSEEKASDFHCGSAAATRNQLRPGKSATPK